MKKNTKEVVVNQENFQEKWEYVNKKLAEMKQKRIIRRVVTLVGNAIFFLYIVLVTFGAMTRISEASWLAFINKCPVLPGVWKAVEHFFLHPELHWAKQVAIYILPSYVITVLLCLLIFILLRNLYKPVSNVQMTGEDAVDSKELYKMAKGVDACVVTQPIATSFACNLVYTLGLLFVFSMYVMGLVASNDVEALGKVMVLLSVFNPALISIPFLCAYSLVNLILGYMLKPMYSMRFESGLVDAAEKYYRECNPDLQTIYEEEEKILAQAKEIREKRKQEQDELENTYKIKPNPIIKKIKLGLRIAVVVGFIGFIIWFVNTDKVKEITKYLDFSKVDFNISDYLDSTEGTEGTEVTEVPEGSEG